MISLEFTDAEVKVIARLAGNLMACAFEAGQDAGVLESIYYKTSSQLDDDVWFAEDKE